MSLYHFLADTSKAGTRNVNVHTGGVEGSVNARRELEVRIARRRMQLVIFEAVQVLVALAAHVAFEGFLFLHAECAGVGS